MTPTLERLIVGVPFTFVHDRLKPPPINRFKKTSKDAIAIAHARPLLSLDNQNGSVCTVPAEHAPRHSESFPGQPCASRGGDFHCPSARPTAGAKGPGPYCIAHKAFFGICSYKLSPQNRPPSH